MIAIDEKSLKSVLEVPFLAVSRIGELPAVRLLEIEVIHVDGLSGVQALVVTGDLQSRVPYGPDGRPGRLLGEYVADEIAALGELGVLPSPSKVGVVLTGDLYCDEMAIERGASGDVRPVWEAFDRHFAFVTGVLGNHDELGPSSESVAFRAGAGRYLLDGRSMRIAGIHFGGVSGVMGSRSRANRLSQGDYLSAVRSVVSSGIDVLVVHESPSILELGFKGSDPLRGVVESAKPILMCCGHVRWTKPFARLESGTTILNTDGRCVVLVQD